MEEPVASLIEKMLYKKIMLYNDLLNCFYEERASLININLDRLWRISTEKEEICTRIESLRVKILSAVNQNDDQKSFNLKQMMDLIPFIHRERFQTLYLKLVKLKGEIDAARKENKVFIEDSLQFLDEMMSIIANETKSEFTYNDKRNFDPSSSHFFVNREV